jgi:L,D-transpeptidase YcbB
VRADGWLVGDAVNTPPQSALGETLSEQAQDELRASIAAANPSDLRWPNFTDYRDQVFTFYESGAFSLAWIRNETVTTQAQTMVALFKAASQYGLEPDDYDGSRWDSRLARMRQAATPPSQTELIDFDLALTVCAMRYVSDLRVGRVNPQHFKFGLDVGPKRYDLTDFLRNEVVYSQDVAGAIDKLEPPYADYQQAKAALATYLELAAEGDGESLPMPARTVRPGQAYAGMAQLHPALAPARRPSGRR